METEKSMTGILKARTAIHLARAFHYIGYVEQARALLSVARSYLQRRIT